MELGRTSTPRASAIGAFDTEEVSIGSSRARLLREELEPDLRVRPPPLGGRPALVPLASRLGGRHSGGSSSGTVSWKPGKTPPLLLAYWCPPEGPRGEVSWWAPCEAALPAGPHLCPHVSMPLSQAQSVRQLTGSDCEEQMYIRSLLLIENQKTYS